MPGKKIHMAAAAGIGVITFFALDDEPSENINQKITDGIAILASSVYGGRLPDIIEPASSPNHRAFFHSWATLAGVCCLMHHFYKWSPTDPKQKTLRKALIAMCTGYSSHLLLDSRTPKSLPLL